MLQHVNAKFDDFFYFNQKVATHPCKWQWQWWQWCLWKWLWLWWWDDGDDLKDTVEWSSSLPCPWLPYLTHIYFLVLYLCLSVDKYETSFFVLLTFYWLQLTSADCILIIITIRSLWLCTSETWKLSNRNQRVAETQAQFRSKKSWTSFF